MTVDDFLRLIDNDAAPTLGAEAVTAFEAQHGMTLPDDFREFLAATPGGRVRGNVHFSLAGEEDGQEILGSVYGLQSEGSFSLTQRLADVEKDAIPHGLLPIMRDRGGNTLALILISNRLGEIVFLDHEVSDEGRATLEAAEADDWGYAKSFAPSFTALITGFKLATA